MDVYLRNFEKVIGIWNGYASVLPLDQTHRAMHYKKTVGLLDSLCKISHLAGMPAKPLNYNSP